MGGSRDFRALTDWKQSRRNTRQRHFGRIVVPIILLFLLLLLLWSFPSWSFPPVTGPYQVATLLQTYTDESRMETYRTDGSHRWLNVKIWYPDDFDGQRNTCPLILFSHGSFGTKESNEALFRELASHGYFVCSIDHTYQSLGAISPDGETVGLDKTFRTQVLKASDKSDEGRKQLVGLFQEWMDIRMGDMAFVMDTLIAYSSDQEIAEQAYRLIDTTKIGVMGHSLGGSAALGMGRTRREVGAVIAMEAPFMHDVQGVTAEGFVFHDAAYPIPLLHVYSDSAWKILESSPQYAQNQAILKDDLHTTQDIHWPGAGHLSLTDLLLSRPTLCLLFGQDPFLDTADFLETSNRAYMHFFDTFLKQGTDERKN